MPSVATRVPASSVDMPAISHGRSGSARGGARRSRKNYEELGGQAGQVELTARGAELLRLLRKPRLHERCLRRELAQVLGDAHRAELRAAHRAEMGELGALGGERLVVEAPRGERVERQVELVLPAELEPRLRHRVVPFAGPGMTLGEIGGMGGDPV